MFVKVTVFPDSSACHIICTGRIFNIYIHVCSETYLSNLITQVLHEYHGYRLTLASHVCPELNDLFAEAGAQTSATEGIPRSQQTQDFDSMLI